jgi:hypothetical protein
MTARDIEQIAYDWPRSWAGWIRKSSSPLVVLESKDGTDGNEDHEKINCRDVRKCHGPTSLLTKEKVGEYQREWGFGMTSCSLRAIDLLY